MRSSKAASQRRSAGASGPRRSKPSARPWAVSPPEETAMNLRRVQRTRTVISLLLAIVLLLPTGISVASDTATPISPAPVLVSIRAAHHPGFDRVVFDFAGALPSRRDAHYVNRLVADPSGASIPMPSGAILKVTFHPAIAHTRAGRPTTARRIAFA